MTVRGFVCNFPPLSKPKERVEIQTLFYNCSQHKKTIFCKLIKCHKLEGSIIFYDCVLSYVLMFLVYEKNKTKDKDEASPTR